MSTSCWKLSVIGINNILTSKKTNNRKIQTGEKLENYSLLIHTKQTDIETNTEIIDEKKWEIPIPQNTINHLFTREPIDLHVRYPDIENRTIVFELERKPRKIFKKGRIIGSIEFKIDETKKETRYEILELKNKKEKKKTVIPRTFSEILILKVTCLEKGEEKEDLSNIMGNMKLKALVYETQLISEQNTFDELDKYYDYIRFKDVESGEDENDLKGYIESQLNNNFEQFQRNNEIKTRGNVGYSDITAQKKLIDILIQQVRSSHMLHQNEKTVFENRIQSFFSIYRGTSKTNQGDRDENENEFVEETSLLQSAATGSPLKGRAKRGKGQAAAKKRQRNRRKKKKQILELFVRVYLRY